MRIAYRNYLLGLLTVIMVFNYVDRIALGLMLQDIKAEMHLSDTQLGLLTGIAFAFFYAVMGIPIARWADRGNRVRIIALTTGIWSAAVALCSTATGFLHLLAIRVGVAVGEAGCHPPALSLIADHFNRAERPRAVARYMLGWPLALLIGFFAGGWLNQIYGWRTTFLILGLPGVVLGLIAWLSLKEPRRAAAADRHCQDATPASPQAPGLRQVATALWGNRSFRQLLFCCSLSYFFGNGILQWQPAFFVRTYGIETGALGTWFAAIYGLGGLLGTVIGGELASRYAADDERLQLRAMAILYCGLAILGASVYLAPSAALALTILSVSAIGSATVNGPLFAATQTLVAPPMRALAVAVVLFFCNLVGMGLGPLAAGALSDALRPVVGEESLRYALLALTPGYVWCAYHLWRGSRSVREDVARAGDGVADPLRSCS